MCISLQLAGTIGASTRVRGSLQVSLCRLNMLATRTFTLLQYQFTTTEHTANIRIVGWDFLGRCNIYTDRLEIHIVVGSTCLRDKPIWRQIRQTMKVTTTKGQSRQHVDIHHVESKAPSLQVYFIRVVHVTCTRNHECTSKNNSTLWHQFMRPRILATCVDEWRVLMSRETCTDKPGLKCEGDTF